MWLHFDFFLHLHFQDSWIQPFGTTFDILLLQNGNITNHYS